MNVDELDQVMRGITGSKETKQHLRVISHWIKRIKDSKNSEYVMYDEAELNSLLKLQELKLVAIKEGLKDEKIGVVHVTLTESGADLYKDFFKTGYFLKA
ncbi:MAG: hypothetical protein J4400_02740 [Candidatus Aenigmarchaeota archaeon]|nr:hypothetical protein [Candidatus Aenigmarchaeota archaeon]